MNRSDLVELFDYAHLLHLFGSHYMIGHVPIGKINENEPYYSWHATRDPKAARVHRAVPPARSGQRIQISRKEILNCYQICQ